MKFTSVKKKGWKKKTFFFAKLLFYFTHVLSTLSQIFFREECVVFDVTLRSSQKLMINTSFSFFFASTLSKKEAKKFHGSLVVHRAPCFFNDSNSSPKNTTKSPSDIFLFLSIIKTFFFVFFKFAFAFIHSFLYALQDKHKKRIS